MITYVKGDLIEAGKSGLVDVIAHQANCQLVFGAGLARQIKQHFPVAYEADCQTKKGDKNKLGTLSMAYDQRYNLYIFNLYGQYRYGRDKQHTDYEALENSLKEMYFVLRSGTMHDPEIKPDCRIGIPRLGCGLAGGDWNIVESLVDKTIGKRYDVFVYDL